MKTKPGQIIATYSVKANGFAATLEFPNGGRQVGISRFSSSDEAQMSAEHMLRLRIAHPEKCVPDPETNRYMDLQDA